jgi:nitrogen fixation protein NifU and related proteins
MDLRMLAIAANTENNKVLDSFTHKSKNKNRICGDEMEISLRITKDIIEDMGYQCKSCVYCQAAVSLLSRKIKNKNIEETKKFIDMAEIMFEGIRPNIEKHWEDFVEILDKKNLARKECLLLPLRTVLKALEI